jgi:hypothetical protein
LHQRLRHAEWEIGLCLKQNPFYSMGCAPDWVNATLSEFLPNFASCKFL